MKRVLAMCMAALMMCFLIPSAAKAASDRVTISVTADKTTANPGDTVKFEVKLGAVEDLGGLDFNVAIPEGLTMIPDSITMQDGLKDILKSDGDIVKPAQINSWRWSYSVGAESYTGTKELSILSFSCTVNNDAAFEKKSVTLDNMVCFDGAVDMNDIAVDLVPASFTVEKAAIHVSGVTLNQTSLSMKDGETSKLTAAVAPSNADNQNVSWKSDNSAVATVAADGTVTAVKAGTAVITVTTADGGKTASCTVAVNCNHSLTKTDAVAPTCGKDGNIEYYTCSKCGSKFSDAAGTKEITNTVDPATGKHGETEIKGAVAATEDKEGYTGDTYCKVCGNKIADGNAIAKLPHTHAMVKTAAVAATCETDGNVEYWTCSKCGKKYADANGAKEIINVTVKAKGHTPGAWSSDETNHWRKCTVCGKEIDKSAHAFRWVVDKAATEDETGLSHEECACGVKRSENTVLPKLDHVHTGIQRHEAVAATCTAKGSVEYWTCSSAKCAGKYYGDSACQIAITDIEIPVNPDNHVYDNDADSDCKLCGYKRFYVMTAGADAIYEKGSENGLTFTADGAYGLFQSVEVDGNTMDKAYYEVKEGSTVVTLAKAYLETLRAEDHTIRILYTDGKAASAKFSVREIAEEDDDNDSNNANTDNANKAVSPKTGDMSRPEYSIAIMVICMAMAAALLVYKKKSSNE